MSIKFLYNGIKCSENDNVLEKCFYELDNDDGAIVVVSKEKQMFFSEIQNKFEPHELPEDDEEFAGHDCFCVLPGEDYWKEMAQAAIKFFSKQAKKLEKKLSQSDKVKAEEAKTQYDGLMDDIKQINGIINGLEGNPQNDTSDKEEKADETKEEANEAEHKESTIDDLIGDGIALPQFEDEDEDESSESSDKSSEDKEEENSEPSGEDNNQDKVEQTTGKIKKKTKKNGKKGSELNFMNYKLGLSATIFEKEKTVSYFSKNQSPLQQSIPFEHGDLFKTIKSIMDQGYEVCSMSAKEAIERVGYIRTKEDADDFLVAYNGKLFPALIKEISHNIKESGMHIDVDSYQANLNLMTSLFER